MAESTDPKKLHVGQTVTFAIIGALLLLIANSAIWFNKYVFDQANFTRLTTSAIQQESSRQAISAEISGRIFANRPVLAGVAEEPATNMISGLLGSDLAQKVFTRATNSLHAIATSPNPQDITLDLTTIKQIVARLSQIFGVAEAGETAVQVQDIPDTITIVDAQNVPNIYTFGVVLLWVGPFAAILALGLIFYTIFKARRSWQLEANVFAINAASLVGAGILALLIGPLFRPMVLSSVQSTNMRTVADNLYSSFITTFNQQTIWLFIAAAVFLLAAIIIWVYPPISDWVKQRAKST